MTTRDNIHTAKARSFPSSYLRWLPIFTLVAFAWFWSFAYGSQDVAPKKTPPAAPASKVEKGTTEVTPPIDIDVDQAQTEPITKSITRRQSVMASLTIFVLAIFVGFEVITKVPPTLHTPLMSGSNAISGITVVGAILVTGTSSGFASVLGLIAVVFASINVVGGFLVTHRMLAMFRRRKS